jgi:hypothetical protein
MAIDSSCIECARLDDASIEFSGAVVVVLTDTAESVVTVEVEDRARVPPAEATVTDGASWVFLKERESWIKLR